MQLKTVPVNSLPGVDYVYGVVKLLGKDPNLKDSSYPLQGVFT
jgi:hypothetical protein